MSAADVRELKSFMAELFVNHTNFPGQGYTYAAVTYPLVQAIAAGDIKFPGQQYSLGAALANQGHSIIGLIGQLIAMLDPDQDGVQGVDIEKVLRESEARMSEDTAAQLRAHEQTMLEQQTVLRAELIASLAAVPGVTVDTIAEGVDLALSRAFPTPVTAG